MTSQHGAKGPQRGEGDAWGHKLTISVYVPGSMQTALDVADQLGDALNLPQITFAGIAVDQVDERPYDQGAS